MFVKWYRFPPNVIFRSLNSDKQKYGVSLTQTNHTLNGIRYALRATQKKQHGIFAKLSSSSVPVQSNLN